MRRKRRRSVKLEYSSHVDTAPASIQAPRNTIPIGTWLSREKVHTSVGQAFKSPFLFCLSLMSPMASQALCELGRSHRRDSTQKKQNKMKISALSHDFFFLSLANPKVHVTQGSPRLVLKPRNDTQQLLRTTAAAVNSYQVKQSHARLLCSTGSLTFETRDGVVLLSTICH